MTSTSDDLFLKRGYQALSNAAYYDFEDHTTASNTITYQPDVYPVAADLAAHYESNWIIDVGCGRTEKLVEYARDFKIVGIDTGPNITFCREKYPQGTWLDVDLEFPGQLPLSEEQVAGSVIVCSDVIEHLVDPRPLLHELARLRESAATIVLSTPDRDRTRGLDDVGPPSNPFHVREWNIDELGRLLSFYGLEPMFLGYTMDNNADWQKDTSLAIIEGKRIPPLERPPDDFRVVAVMTAYNERDILPFTVQRLLDQGIEVVVIDNWSTDGTFEAIKTIFSSSVQVLRFPDSDTGTYDWALLLNKVEEIGRHSGADWVIHHDADEVREGPWPGMNLRHSIWNVQRRGFNAIDHTVFAFRPVKGEVYASDGADPVDSLLWYEEDVWSFPHVKAWKNGGQAVHLAAKGGHEISFAGRRIFPYKFLLRHYPLRSPDHARRKIFRERGPRWNRKERALDWHTHYDNFDQDDTFLWSVDDLHRWEPKAFCREFLAERLIGVAYLRQGVAYLKDPKNVRGLHASKLYEFLDNNVMFRKVRRTILRTLRR